MEDMKKLNNEELENVSGGSYGGDDYAYSFRYLICPSCGRDVATNQSTRISHNTYLAKIAETSYDVYCNCGCKVGAAIFCRDKS